MNCMELCTIESVIARLAAERDRLKAENKDLKNALEEISKENAELNEAFEKVARQNIRLWLEAYLENH
mgnify:CR=1 FL=1